MESLPHVLTPKGALPPAHCIGSPRGSPLAPGWLAWRRSRQACQPMGGSDFSPWRLRAPSKAMSTVKCPPRLVQVDQPEGLPEGRACKAGSHRKQTGIARSGLECPTTLDSRADCAALQSNPRRWGGAVYRSPKSSPSMTVRAHRNAAETSLGLAEGRLKRNHIR